MTVSERDRIGGEEFKKLELIRRAALKSFATRGAAATSLRSVAADAGVSLGLVQHHFETKAGLIKAVDDYVMGVVIEMVSRPPSAHPRDSIADMGSRITNLLIAHPDVADYFGRALIDGSDLGATRAPRSGGRDTRLSRGCRSQARPPGRSGPPATSARSAS